MALSIQQARLCAAALLAAASVAGCNDNTTTVPANPPPVSVTPQNFSTFATGAFAQPADATPVSLPSALVFDVNDDPTAFSALLM